MGSWRQVRTVYGFHDRWVPEGYPDWPTVEGDEMVGIPEQQPDCTCGGKLERWKVVVNAEDIARAERTNQRALRSPKVQPVKVPVPVLRWRYEFSHYRECLPSSAPEPELVRPRRV